jgi:Zn-dependent protease with chaperone function
MNFYSVATQTQSYVQEYKAFKNDPANKTMFHKDSQHNLKDLQRDIEIYKELSFLQRAIRFVCFFFDSVVVTSTNMPKLHAYIDGACKKNDITTPAIFIATNHNFFNAFATKLLVSSGAIVIGQRLLLESSDKGLEGIIAHELGHIKYNHINKNLALNLGTYFGSQLGINFIMDRYVIPKMNEEIFALKDFEKQWQLTQYRNAQVNFIKGWMPILILYSLPELIINKRFEKEADDFAYRIMDNGEGLKEFFEKIERTERWHDNQFDETSEKLKENKDKLGYIDYIRLNLRYYLSKGKHYGFKWLYYETPYGAHPSAKARIKAIEEYQAKKAATL